MRKKFNFKEKETKQRPLVYTYQFKVNHSDTLLAFLLAKCKMSRNSIKSLLSDHKVLVNGTVVKQFDYPLAKDDEVKISKSSVYASNKKDKKKQETENSIQPVILYEDKEFLAINKPAGLLSVESDKDRNSAYAWVVSYLQKKDPKARPYILHRIDKQTSGVLIFCKDIKLQSMLRMHWNEDIKKREYIALVEGTMEKKEDTLIAYLKENQNNMVYVCKDHTGKKAITHYEVLKENKDYSLLRVEIDTGRKNQIRVMFKDKGHPVVGDDKYGDSEGPIGRLGLHASKLEFIHPVSKKLISIKAPMPKEFKDLF